MHWSYGTLPGPNILNAVGKENVIGRNVIKRFHCNCFIISSDFLFAINPERS